LGILILAFGLRLARLTFQPLWWDEGYTLYFATSTTEQLITRTAMDIHPPFYYLLLQAWIGLAGPSPFAVRTLSVVIGTLIVALVYLVGRRLFPRPVGLVTAALASVAPFLVYYSQEARMYALVTLLGLISTYLLWELLEGDKHHAPRPLLAGAYIAVTCAAMYTLYYGAFIPVFQTLFVLLRARHYGRRVWAWLGGQVLLALLYLPWAVYAGGKLQAYVVGKVEVESYASLGFLPFLAKYLSAFSVGHLAPGLEWLAWGALLFLPLALGGGMAAFLGSKGHRASALGLVGLYLAAPLLLGYLVNLLYPFNPPNVERLLLLSTPAFLLLVGMGLCFLGRRMPWVAAAVALVLVVISALSLLVFYTSERYSQDDYRPLISKVDALSGPGDVILCVYPWQIGYFRSYSEIPSASLYSTPSEAWSEDPSLMASELDSLSRRHPRLWLPAYQSLGRMLEGDIEAYLDQHAYRISREWYGTTLLSLYAAGDEPPMAEFDLGVGDELQLQAIGLSRDPLEAGWGIARVALRWSSAGCLTEEHQLRLRLVGPLGRTWSQSDMQLPDLAPLVTVLDRRGLPVPAGAPPGAYSIRLGVYRARDQAWLDILGGEGQPHGVEISIGGVDVTVPSSPPPVDALPIQSSMDAYLGDDLRFLGYTMGQEALQPGGELSLVLFWQARSDVSEDYRSFIQLQGPDGRLWPLQDVPPGSDLYPTSSWTRGQLIRDPRDLTVPGDAPSGTCRLLVSLYDPVTEARLPVRGVDSVDDSLILASVEILGRPRIYQAPVPEMAQNASFGDAARLLGYRIDAPGEIRTGDQIQLVLYWQALGATEESFSVFVHLLDEDGSFRGQGDGIPCLGECPTTGWVQGEYLTDEHRILADAAGSERTCHFVVGLYDPSTGARLPAVDEAGRALGDHIILEGSSLRLYP
jgi:4-amino-4-deoxy-L-arabinose transferase-like glycosyltransferase